MGFFISDENPDQFTKFCEKRPKRTYIRIPCQCENSPPPTRICIMFFIFDMQPAMKLKRNIQVLSLIQTAQAFTRPVPTVRCMCESLPPVPSALNSTLLSWTYGIIFLRCSVAENNDEDIDNLSESSQPDPIDLTGGTAWFMFTIPGLPARGIHKNSCF